MASVAEAQSSVAAQPAVKRKPKARARVRSRKRARGGILWIAVSGILLAGVVFVNVGVLRLNLALDSANAERVKLRAQNAALQSQYSALISSPRIESQAAKELGLVYEDPSDYGHIDVSK